MWVKVRTGRTRISNSNSDGSALEVLSVEIKSLLQALLGCKLCVPESLGSHLLAVLDDSDADNLA